MKNIKQMVEFMKQYTEASNAASGSTYDPNSNVTDKNIATMAFETPKRNNIDINRLMMQNKLETMYGKELATQYFEDLSRHIIYKHDETNLIPTYCCSITMYPFICNGLKDIGGTSDAPKHADTFCGGFCNMAFIVASQFAGAVATPEFLTYLDHFLRIDYGNDYRNHLNDVVELGLKPRTLKEKIEALFSQVVYTINQPAAARGAQSIFWNIAYFDRYYFASIFKDFYFPDGDVPNWDSVSALQKMFMKWFNAERLKKVLTFPVETLNLLHDGKEYKDKEWADFAAEMWSEGHSFFCYDSDSVDALASCCRLRNAIVDNVFSYTLGAGGIQTGSKGVITLNLNRITQDWKRSNSGKAYTEYLKEIVERVHKYLKAFNSIIHDYYNEGMLTIFKAEYINLDRQYLTVGINGFVEAAEFLGYNIKPDDENYKKFAKDTLSTISASNKADKEPGCMFNTEFVPAEGLGVKNAKWDKEDGYFVPRSVYNSYFYVVEDPSTNILDKFLLHGRDFTGWCDGGSALHMNLDDHLTKEQYRTLLDVAIKVGCPYFTFNIPNTVCNDCGNITKEHLDHCPKCGSKNVDELTRVIGYLRRVSNFSSERQVEAHKRYYADPKKDYKE
jgi:anaerobic ribonucleoside-triphosphate reductase